MLRTYAWMDPKRTSGACVILTRYDALSLAWGANETARFHIVSGGALTALPLAAQGQQSERVRLIGMLLPIARTIGII